MKRALGALTAAILGLLALILAPSAPFTYSLFGPGGENNAFSALAWLLPLVLSLVAAGFLARLAFRLSPWWLGPATVLVPAAWFLLVATIGEEAGDYRRAWPKALLYLVGTAVPGTIGACLGELASRWRRRERNPDPALR